MRNAFGILRERKPTYWRFRHFIITRQNVFVLVSPVAWAQIVYQIKEDMTNGFSHKRNKSSAHRSGNQMEGNIIFFN